MEVTFVEVEVCSTTDHTLQQLLDHHLVLHRKSFILCRISILFISLYDIEIQRNQHWYRDFGS